MENKGIIGILSILLLGSTLGNLTQWEQDHAYICNTTQEIGIFDRLSSTGVTGYWNENGIEKRKICKEGKWEKFNGVVSQPKIKEWLCDNNGCTPK